MAETVIDLATAAAADSTGDDSGLRKVTYRDGSSETIDIRSPIYTLRASRVKRDGEPLNPIEFGLHVVWQAAGQPDGDLDIWAARTRSIDMAEEATPGPPELETPPE